MIDNRHIAKECACEIAHAGLARTIDARVRLAVTHNGGGCGGGGDGGGGDGLVRTQKHAKFVFTGGWQRQTRAQSWLLVSHW